MRRLDHLRHLLANRPLAALVTAGAISGIGDWVYLTALPVLVFQRTGDAALVGLAVIGRLIPFFLMSVPAGVVADRFPRRLILITSESVRGVAMLLISVLCLVGADILPMILLTVVAAAAGTFSFPAQASLTPELAADDAELGRANAAFAALDSLACVLGPGLAGILILTGGLPLAFALNGLSFGAVAIALIIWRPRPIATANPATPVEMGVPTPEPLARTLRWTELLHRIAGPLALDGAISLASASLSVMVVVIAVDLLHGDASLTGVLDAGGGLGGILGGIAAGLVVNGRTRLGVSAAVLAFAVAMLLLGVTAAAIVAFVAIAVAVGSMTMLDSLNTTLLQRLTADGTTGRAFGILHSLAALWMMAGVALSTGLIAAFGIAPAVAGVGVAVLILGGASVVLPIIGRGRALSSGGALAAFRRPARRAAVDG